MQSRPSRLIIGDRGKYLSFFASKILLVNRQMMEEDMKPELDSPRVQLPAILVLK